MPRFLHVLPGPVLLSAFTALAASASDNDRLLYLAREPLSLGEIQSLGRTDDALALEILLPAVTGRLGLRRSLGRIAPPDLDAELAEALLSIERLDAEKAENPAREVLRRVPPDCRPAWIAREILARRGDDSVVREAMLHFFAEPERWGRILGEAARSTGDPRLLDFLDVAPLPAPGGPADLYLTTLERHLASSRDEWKLAEILFWAEENRCLSAARVLSHIPVGTLHEDWVSDVLAGFAGPQGDSADRAVRLRALAALGWRKSTKRAGTLLGTLDDEDPAVAAVSARALGEMGYEEAVPQLRQKALSSGKAAASAAIEALVGLAGSEEALRLSREIPTWSFETAAPIVRSLPGEPEAVLRVVKAVSKPEDRVRLLRMLAERDDGVLTRLAVHPSEIQVLHPYLARSNHPGLRALLLQVPEEARGSALAALILSPWATPIEKKAAAKAFEEAWPQAVVLGGRPIVEEIEHLSLELDPSSWTGSPHALDALSILPGPEARKLLESLGTVEAIERLMRRDDRIVALPALSRLRREGGGDVREAAEIGLLVLNAPGSELLRSRWLTDPGKFRAFSAFLADVPEAREILQILARGRDRRPGVQAALSTYYQSHPADFLALLASEEPSVHRRVHSALALSDRPERVPLLADVAVNSRLKDSRRAALRGLAAADLGRFAPLVHRNAGDRDRDIRFDTAAALTPTGEIWALKLLLAEMDVASRRDRQTVRRAIGKLPRDEARRLLEQIFWEGTGNLFSTCLFFFDYSARLTAERQKRIGELIAGRLDESRYALLLAARLDRRDVAREVIARLK